MRIGLVARFDMPEAVELAGRVASFLLNRGVELTVDLKLTEELPILREYGADIRDMDADMIVTIGGDGTILRTQSLIEGKEIPILGINMGTVGFLTEVDPENVFSALEDVLMGEYAVEKRTLLSVHHNGKLPLALNEVVMMTRKPAKMLHIEISVDDEIVEELRADGIIIATPSGSTAYSMSAGGPIVDPRVEAFLIVPICPFKLSARPIVVSNKSTIKVKLLRKGKKAIAVIDGQYEEEINHMDEVIFRKSDSCAHFVRLSKDFYRKVREKLIEGGIDSIKGH
ncbi:NAD(+) kinase [Methanothermobacter wolfeii]|uniref:NAD kinase n=2 Tax=Methanobacteriaceae TaxID=2159 RepID=A0A9E7RT09_METWO|nr:MULTISPECIES: NAD(+) kinase [Methanothermobacter]UXH31170.1 NAD(+) kinase [Methanothermobacter wolfeii]SCM57763.1 NAD kinase {ECO:0000255/HAMAP-Rule:MF_00361} [Methanothermobacter wolfeii]